MVLMTAMIVGTAAMAQRQKPDATTMIQKRTENMVKKYGLDKTQAKQLLELNTKYAGTMGSRIGQRSGKRGPAGIRQGNKRGVAGARSGKDSVARKRPQLTKDQQAAFLERRKQAQESTKAYDTELQTIMTADQYKSYKADAERRMPMRKANVSK